MQPQGDKRGQGSWPGRGEGTRSPGKARTRGRAVCFFLMFLRTRKQKSKIDFALLDKSNKMVSGVKLILTKQNPRRLNKARRLRIKTTTTTKQLQRRLYTPKKLLFSAPPLYGTQRRRTRDSHMWERNTDAMGAALRGARAPRTELFTLWTRSCAGASLAAGAPGLCPSFSCRRRAAASCRGPSSRGARRRALALAIRPSVCPAVLPPVRASQLWLPLPLALRRRRGCLLLLLRHAGFPCPPARAAAEPPLPAGGRALPGAPGRGRRAVRRGKQVPWSCCARVPRAGAAQPAVSPLPRQASSGPPAPPLLPRTSAP